MTLQKAGLPGGCHHAEAVRMEPRNGCLIIAGKLLYMVLESRACRFWQKAQAMPAEFKSTHNPI